MNRVDGPHSSKIRRNPIRFITGQVTQNWFFFLGNLKFVLLSGIKKNGVESLNDECICPNQAHTSYLHEEQWAYTNSQIFVGT